MVHVIATVVAAGRHPPTQAFVCGNGCPVQADRHGPVFAPPITLNMAATMKRDNSSKGSLLCNLSSPISYDER